ncbi:hypothetical protein GGQ04_002805 [Salinibacter ruber]|uniref:hypothetical protein n=1 Tax=Salinibacter ruber TaxID=146919 RepID=UPI002167D64C|nr:hypothetical protein [Salinibacter ruber]MCS4047656.1 hypothetical protein [Salinibacter ruber]
MLPLTFLTYRLRDETPSGMLVAELITKDLRKTRYQIESTGDISKTQQGYRIDTAGRETMRFSEEEVESISVVEEYLCGGVASLRSRVVEE